MKKCLLLLLFIGLFYIAISNIMAEKLEIPEDAIRIRVVPNSNSDYDQRVKGKVKTALEKQMYDLLKDASDSSNARDIINSNLDKIDKNVNGVMIDEEYGYKINYGYNYFPEKEYKGIKYDEGYYESLLVTLGKGEGDNWWCVLFPPLCLIEAEETDNVTYKSLVKEILDKYL